MMVDKLKPLFGEEIDEIDDKKDSTENPNTTDEQKFVHEVMKNQENAESVRGYNDTDGTYGIEQIWDDEQKIFIGGGKQWETSFAYRSKRVRRVRPNSEDNFVFSSVMNIVDNITINKPDVVIEGREDGDAEVAEKLTFLSRYNDGVYRNNFHRTWRKMVQQFTGYGPIIGAVLWDNDWIGGSGPNRWVGDVRILHIDRRDIYFDPAIIDLEERLQECSFIHRKFRKKLIFIRDKWPDEGKGVSEDTNDSEFQDEGSDPKQVWLIEAWHRGRPKFINTEKKQELLQRAAEAEAKGDPYKAQELRDMAAGKVIGIHRGYVANGVLLEYEPYVYDDGEYPFVYKVLYFDENSPHGFGEIRNIKIPQVMHNKADEIEIEAMSREGLGGMYYKTGSVSAKQLESINKNSGKGGVWQEVDDTQQLKEREGVKVPQSVREYKEHKQRMIETISQNTPIQQGMSPSSNMPYRAIAELGARTDVRTKAKGEILKEFLIEINRKRISRFVQSYTEERYYRLKGSDGKVIEGTFTSSEAQRSWEREPAQVDPATGQIVAPAKNEMFIPEFDIDVKILDEKPQDRGYYTNTAFELAKMNAMTVEHLWYTLEEGKFPPMEQVLEDLKARDAAMQLAEMMKAIPLEQQQMVMETVGRMGQMAQMQMQGGGPGATQEGQVQEGGFG